MCRLPGRWPTRQARSLTARRDEPPASDRQLKLAIVWNAVFEPEPYPARALPSEAIRLFIQAHAPHELDELAKFSLSSLDARPPASGGGPVALEPGKSLEKNGVVDGDSLLLTKSMPHHETRSDRVAALAVGLYSFAVFLVALTALVAVWPASTADLSLNATRTITLPVTLLGATVTLGPEIMLALIMLLAGLVGASVFSFYAISLHLGHYKDFDDAWVAWYLLRPPMGAGLAFIAYVLIRGGILTVGASSASLNFFGVAGIAFLVGLFAEHFMIKLHALADEAFGAPPDERAT